VALAFAEPLPALSNRLATSATVACLVSLSALLAAFGSVYAQRLSQLRAETARNEKLAVLGRLVGSMSHELNTPLATILLSSRDLRDYESSIDEAERAQLIATIVREAERANDIVGLVRGHVGPDQSTEPVELAEFVERFATEELDRLGFEGERRFLAGGAGRRAGDEARARAGAREPPAQRLRSEPTRQEASHHRDRPARRPHRGARRGGSGAWLQPRDPRAPRRALPDDEGRSRRHGPRHLRERDARQADGLAARRELGAWGRREGAAEHPARRLARARSAADAPAEAG
jgi:hypothetical protein